MMKLIHAGLNVLAFILAVISVVAVFDFHNAKNIPNMYSLHSWIGLAVVILYPAQVSFHRHRGGSTGVSVDNLAILLLNLATFQTTLATFSPNST